MQKVEAAKVSFTTAELSVTNAGVEAHAVAAKTETVVSATSLVIPVFSVVYGRVSAVASNALESLLETSKVPKKSNTSNKRGSPCW
jgi:hypothetical protein